MESGRWKGQSASIANLPTKKKTASGSSFFLPMLPTQLNQDWSICLRPPTPQKEMCFFYYLSTSLLWHFFAGWTLKGYIGIELGNSLRQKDFFCQKCQLATVATLALNFGNSASLQQLRFAMANTHTVHKKKRSGFGGNSPMEKKERKDFIFFFHGQREGKRKKNLL